MARWMPSHLDNPSKAKERELAIRQRIVSTEDIDGNVEADRLAKTGSTYHSANDDAY